MQYSYPPEASPVRGEGELEFYVFSSNKDLMRHLSDILKRKGYLGLADGGGRMHYIVDGRNNLHRTAGVIESVSAAVAHGHYVQASEADLGVYKKLRQTVEVLLLSKGISQKLKGFAYLEFLLVEMIPHALYSSTPDKSMYSRLCTFFETGRPQADRVIRYALKTAGIEDGNQKAIVYLMAEGKRLWEEQQKRTVSDDSPPESVNQ